MIEKNSINNELIISALYILNSGLFFFSFSSLVCFQSRALTGVCEKTVQVTSDPSKSELSCLEEVHITNIKPGEGLVSTMFIQNISGTCPIVPVTLKRGVLALRHENHKSVQNHHCSERTSEVIQTEDLCDYILNHSVLYLCFYPSGYLHQVHLRRASRHHGHDRERECAAASQPCCFSQFTS